VKEKESLCRIYYSEKSNLTECIKLLQNAYKISDKIYPKKDIILDLRGF
jgi:thymidine phosphorylase